MTCCVSKLIFKNACVDTSVSLLFFPYLRELVAGLSDCLYSVSLSTANVSVLRWWFEDKSARLVINESLRVELAPATDQRFWEIRLSGTTSFA